MAKLNISAEFLLSQLFGNASPRPAIEIKGVSFDMQRDVVELDIVGPEIPQVERIDAVLTIERSTVKFIPRS